MAKKYFVFCLGLILLLSSCSDDEIGGGLTAYDESVIDYFSEIALGFEFGGDMEVTRKWTSQMKIFVGGTKNPDLMNELQEIVTEINALATDGFNITMVTDTLQSNFYIFLGTGSRYASIFPSQAGLVADNWGLFSVFWTDNQLYQGFMYVDLIRANSVEQRHLLREELTQSLGLAKDSPLYEESIFQSRFTETNEYADIDKDLIRLLYHPNMQVGLNKEQVEEVLRGILLSEK
ncbi:MAG TPA: DUF2927 domain-containing protein [Chryseolinea sp.]|nr:DUF2927 domain-containing protein [Chryseolinea sp.]